MGFQSVLQAQKLKKKGADRQARKRWPKPLVGTFQPLIIFQFSGLNATNSLHPLRVHVHTNTFVFSQVQTLLTSCISSGRL